MTRREFAAFVGPSAAVMLTLLVFPLLMTLTLSLGHLSDTGGWSFRGLDNYKAVLGNDRYVSALVFTLIYCTISMPIHIAIGFVLALALDCTPSRLHAPFVGMLAMPFVMTPIVGTLIFSWFFKDYFGLFPWLLGLVRVHLDWFSQVWPARWTLILWAVWWATGFNVMVLFAGLQTLDRDQHRAAMIDGAGPWRRLFNITVPHMLPFFLLVTIFNLMDSYRVFDSVYIITQGGPGTATESLEYFNYKLSFVTHDIGGGAAVSMLDVVGILVLLGPLLWWSARSRRGR